MAHRRRKPATQPTTRTATPADHSDPRGLWREAGRRAALGLAGSTGPVVVASVEWWLRTR
ncbi:hypothetical protein [Streptomyces sp. NPDC001422]|uniref:hypothetical protein n=1 Tax=Streptomyces sp. NPDC001422 TaxID=3364575 RepID=UPI0036798E10